MSYGIMGSFRNSHMFVYQTTRFVKCVYFDGESAGMMNGGQLDTQMLHIYGNLTGPPRRPGRDPNPIGDFVEDEYARATGLCDWLRVHGLGGSGFGYEGIVRMNTGFEMIWCNFTSPSLRLGSSLNVTAPLLPPDDEKEQHLDANLGGGLKSPYFAPLDMSVLQTDSSTGSSNTRQASFRGTLKREPFTSSKFWLWFSSGVDHYGSSADGPGLGEVRVRPATCGFLNYYAPEFTNQAESRILEEQKRLNLTKEGHWVGATKDEWRYEALKSLTRRRRLHGLEWVTVSDAALMRKKSERVLRSLSQSPTTCSGVDWNLVTNEVVQTYAGPLNVLRESLRKYERLPGGNQTALADFVASIREQAHGLLVPFLEYPGDMGNELIWMRGSKLFNETHARCKFQHTLILDPQNAMDFSPEEWSMKWALEETLDSICSVLVEIGLSVEGFWQVHLNAKYTVATNNSVSDEMEWHFSSWAQGVEELMAWLGWEGEWTRCEQKCAIGEKCFIPMAPFIPIRSVSLKTWMNWKERRLSSELSWPDLQMNETTLWNPICANADYIAHLKTF